MSSAWIALIDAVSRSSSNPVVMLAVKTLGWLLEATKTAPEIVISNTRIKYVGHCRLTELSMTPILPAVQVAGLEHAFKSISVRHFEMKGSVPLLTKRDKPWRTILSTRWSTLFEDSWPYRQTSNESTSAGERPCNGTRGKFQ